MITAAARKVGKAVQHALSELTAATTTVEKAEQAVATAQAYFDASPCQASAEALMAAKRELEQQKLFAERGERLVARAQDEQRAVTLDEQQRELAELERQSSIEHVYKQIVEAFERAKPALEALAALDREVNKAVFAGAEAAQRAEHLRASLEGRRYDSERVSIQGRGLSGLERAHQELAREYGSRSGILNKLRWLAGL